MLKKSLSFFWMSSLISLSYLLMAAAFLASVVSVLLPLCCLCVHGWLSSYHFLVSLCGLVSQRCPGSNIATAIHFANTVYTCRCPETLAEKCKLLFLNLSTQIFIVDSIGRCAWVHLELFGHSPAFIAHILHTFLFESCNTLTSLLCLGCSHIVFNLAGVASLACKIPGFILDLWYTLSQCFIPNPEHHPAFYQEANPSLRIVRFIVAWIS